MLDDLVEVAPRAPDPFDGTYLLGPVLGTGGMGVVYSATQLSLGRRVAIKVPHAELATDPFVIRRFRTEALAGGRLTHRNIARVIDYGDRDGAQFLVMEYVGGAPLDQLVIEQGPMEARIAADLAGQVLAALDEAHTAGIIHADIKSANVLVEPLPDGTLLAHVIDFGLARFCNEPSVHEDLLVSGTPDYLAPELIRGGPPTVASDIYAAGVVLYELLTGMTPFCGGSVAEILGRQVDDPVVPPSLRSPDQGIPDAIDGVVMRALAKDPSARFETAARFAEALRAATPAVRTPALRVARGTRPCVFSTEATTRNWQIEQVPVQRVAARPARSEPPRVEDLRIAVGKAITSGDSDSIITSYLELVRALVDGRQLATAATELEQGLEWLRDDTPISAAPPARWRLQLCLAALYSGLGDPVRARGAAKHGQDDAVRAASALGQDRAHELLARLARHGTSASRPARPRVNVARSRQVA